MAEPRFTREQFLMAANSGDFPRVGSEMLEQAAADAGAAEVLAGVKAFLDKRTSTMGHRAFYECRDEIARLESAVRTPEGKGNADADSPRPSGGAADYCHAGLDGECRWKPCPQKRDGEPKNTGRDCPLPHFTDDPEY